MYHRRHGSCILRNNNRSSFFSLLPLHHPQIIIRTYLAGILPEIRPVAFLARDWTFWNCCIHPLILFASFSEIRYLPLFPAFNQSCVFEQIIKCTCSRIDFASFTRVLDDHEPVSLDHDSVTINFHFRLLRCWSAFGHVAKWEICPG